MEHREFLRHLRGLIWRNLEIQLLEIQLSGRAHLAPVEQLGFVAGMEQLQAIDRHLEGAVLP